MKKIASVSNTTTHEVLKNTKRGHSRGSNSTVTTTIEHSGAAESQVHRTNNSDSSIPKKPVSVSPQVIYGQILEIDADAVILRCLIDETEGLFQKRRFARQFFEKTVNLAINQFVEVKIFTIRGGVAFKFANAKREDLAEKFTPKDYFSQFAGTALFQPLTTHIDADNF